MELFGSESVRDMLVEKLYTRIDYNLLAFVCIDGYGLWTEQEAGIGTQQQQTKTISMNCIFRYIFRRYIIIIRASTNIG
jgi:hypothetical protein